MKRIIAVAREIYRVTRVKYETTMLSYKVVRDGIVCRMATRIKQPPVSKINDTFLRYVLVVLALRRQAASSFL